MKALATVLLLGLCLAVFVVYSLNRPYAGFAQPVFVDIRKGTGAAGIAGLLSEAGVIRSRWHFLAQRALRPRARLQAGEYRFSSAASASEVFDRLVRGDVFYYEFTVPEGSNLFDVGGILGSLGVIPAKDFLQAASDPALIADLAPRAPSLEGYLFPSTYRISRHTSAAQVCKMMTDQFRLAWKELGATAPVHETVTVASMVEKETAVAAERRLMASVFANRLRKRMHLDCDPTTIYAALLEDRYRGTIYRSDLDSRNAYNTYRRLGLPPGPIANPGLESLRAALEPAPTNYLYFVARPGNNGSHQFSVTDAEHQRAVARYRRASQPKQQETASRRGPRATQSRAR